MIKSTSTNALKEALKAGGYQFSGFDSSNPNLEIDFGTDAQDRTWKLIVSPSEQKINATEGAPTAAFVNLFVEFPYSAELNSIPDLARLLLLLNKGLPFPAFGFSEIDGIIYFRHTLYCDKDEIPVPVATALIGFISLYIDSLSPMIESVASGKKRLHEALQDMIQSEKP
jgi:hypothetical protein